MLNTLVLVYFQLVVLRDIMQGDESNPQVPMENNARPTMPVNHRVVRTNINFPHKVSSSRNSSSSSSSSKSTRCNWSHVPGGTQTQTVMRDG